MVKNRSYEDLQVWQKAIAFCKVIYMETRKLPKEEMFGLVSQMRRCSVSIASNIAEGCSRNNIKEFKQFFAIASGSAAELKTQLIISLEIGYLSNDIAALLIGNTDEIERMLTGLGKSLEKKAGSQPATRNSQLETTEY